MRNKRGTDAFLIDLMFTHGQIRMQVLLVDSAKRTQKIAGCRPQPFDRIGMDFSDTVAIVIARPFFLAMTHGVMSPVDAVVALPFIGITGGFFLGVAVHVFLQRLPVGMRAHAQPALPTFPADGPDDGRTIVLIGPVPSSVVRAAAWRIAWVAVFVAFFPPRSETSHRFQSPGQAIVEDSTSYTRCLGGGAATDGHTAGRGPVPPLTPSRVRLYKSRGLTTRPGVAPDCCPQKGFLYRGYRRADRHDSDNRQSRVCVSETPAPLPSWLHNRDSAILADESVSRSTPDFRGHPITQ